MGSRIGAGLERLQQTLRRNWHAVSDDAARQAEKAASSVARDSLQLSNAARQVTRSADPELAHLVFKRAAEQGGLKGGHLPKQIMEDQFGQRWMFKTVPTGEEFRALGDKVGGDLLGAVGIPTPKVHLSSQEIDGQVRFGTLQKLVEHSGEKLPADVTQLTQAQVDDLTRSHVGRWLISDHDGKIDNFLVRKSGAVETIDLGQMYRFFPSDSLDRLYRPNAKPPVFNSLWEGYVEGKVHLDFQKGLDQVAKVEALPDRTFTDLLRPYATLRYQQGQGLAGYRTADEFLQAALRRKQNLRRDMLGFYDSLAKERGLSGIEEALGPHALEHREVIRKVGLKPVQKLPPRVAEVWAQSRANAARYKEETLQVLTRKFGSREVAERKYQALYEYVRKDMFLAANYPTSALVKAIKEGRIRSIYDLPVKDQIRHKGLGYVLRRNAADLRLGLRGENPLYVTVGGNKKYARDIAKYGDAMVHYKESELASRVLFSDGNHNYIARNLLEAGTIFRQERFAWPDVPHLTVNRIVKEALDPTEASHLLEGIVYGGLDPRTAAESITLLREQAGVAELVKTAGEAGLPVVR